MKRFACKFGLSNEIIKRKFQNFLLLKFFAMSEWLERYLKRLATDHSLQCLICQCLILFAYLSQNLCDGLGNYQRGQFPTRNLLHEDLPLTF